MKCILLFLLQIEIQLIKVAGFGNSCLRLGTSKCLTKPRSPSHVCSSAHSSQDLFQMGSASVSQNSKKVSDSSKLNISDDVTVMETKRTLHGSAIDQFEADITHVIKSLRAAPDDSLYPPSFCYKKGKPISRMTISYIWDLNMWKRHTSRWRYLRHITSTFRSRLFKRILPMIAVVACWSALYACVIVKLLWNMKPLIMDAAPGGPIPLTSLGLVSTFVAFLLTMRSNQGLSRLAEGRELWGRTFIVTRDTAQLLAAYVYPKDKNLGLKSARHLSIFAWLLKSRLRDTDDTDVITTMLPSNTDKAFILSNRKRPAAIIARIRQVVANLGARNVLPVAAHQQLEQNIHEMNYILGMMERIRGSPIPPVYTSHTTRLLVFYLVFLPVALEGSSISKLVNVLVSSTVAFAMLGLDEISHLLEQPFRLMPMHDLARNMMMDVADAFVCQPPVLKKDDDVSLTVEEEFLYPFDNEGEGENLKPSYW